MICNPLNQVPQTQGVVGKNAFCAAYQRVIKTEEEGEQFGRVTSLAARQRLAANEALYRCECEGWSHEICLNEARQAASQVQR